VVGVFVGGVGVLGGSLFEFSTRWNLGFKVLDNSF